MFSAVLQGVFRFAVFPKRLITFNPMQFVVWRGKKEEYELFSDEDGETASAPTLSYEQYQRLENFLKKKDNPAEVYSLPRSEEVPEGYKVLCLP